MNYNIRYMNQFFYQMEYCFKRMKSFLKISILISYIIKQILCLEKQIAV